MIFSGRQDIFTGIEELTKENVLDEINKALVIHFNNKNDEDYLYNYRKGHQPIINRTKERNGEICCNRIVENHAEEIVVFKNGFLLPHNVSYVARKDEVTKKVVELNEYLYRSGKPQVDNELVNWFHTVGKAYLFIEPQDDDECPFVTYALNPNTAEVVKSLNAGNKPCYAFHAVANGEDLYVDVYTKTTFFRLFGSINAEHPTSNPKMSSWVTKIIDVQPNRLAPYLPIIEYKYSETNMGAFESVIDLLDAINTVQSNRVDGIEQFIQSLLVATNVDFDEDVTADKIRNSGMICLKSTGDNKSDIQILSEQLDQTQTEVLVKSLYDQALTIVGVPSTQSSGGDSSNVGAIIYRNGWQNADAYAKNTEDLFKKSNKYFDEIMLKILKDKLGFEINISDFELSFVRNELSNIQSKAQAYSTLVGSGFAPIVAMELTGITNDPATTWELSKPFYEAIHKAPKEEEEVPQEKAQEIDAQDNKVVTPEEEAREYGNEVTV